MLAVLAGLATAVMLLVLDGMWAGRTMFRGVAGARSALTEGGVAVVTGDPEAARPFFEDAKGDAQASLAAFSHPSIQLAERMPWVGDNLKAVEAVARASEQTAQAGLFMVQAATALGWQDLRVPAVESLGTVDLPTLRAATPDLEAVAKQLGVAEAQLAAADTGRLVGPVATGFEDALETLRRRYRIANNAQDIAHLLPAFLGGGGTRSYLLAVQVLGIPEGTGGRVDLVGTLTADHGRVRLDTPLEPAGDGYTDDNITPDGRVTCEALLETAAADGLGDLDGVILVDSVWLQDALWVTGSADVPGRRAPLTLDDAADVLEIDVFETTNRSAAEQHRAALANAIVESYLARRPSTESFAIGLAGGVAGRHMIVYSTRPQEQQTLGRLGATGFFDPGPNPLAVTWTSLVDNHAVVFANRSSTQTVTLAADGSARVRLVVALANRSAKGPASVVLGLPLPATVEEPAGVNPVGGWAGEVRVYLPPDATQISLETSVPSETRVDREGGRQVGIATLATDPGDSMSLLVVYTVKQATPKGGREYRMLVSQQPTLEPGPVRISIQAPSGATISAASRQLERAGGTARYVGNPTRPETLWVRW